jgi:predicted nucleic acid-binding protein
MEAKKVYLDTSVVSALFDSRTPERQSLTLSMWKTLSFYEVFISEKVLAEIYASSLELREQLLTVIREFTVLKLTEEAEALAEVYIANGIFPEKYFDDALHVALASTNGIGYLLSWNFRHLVKVKTRRLVSLVNTLREYPPVEIIAPPEL